MSSLSDFSFTNNQARRLFLDEVAKLEGASYGDLEGIQKNIFKSLTEDTTHTSERREALTALNVYVAGAKTAHASNAHDDLLDSKRTELKEAQRSKNAAWIAQVGRQVHQLENIGRVTEGAETVPYLGDTEEERERNAQKIRESEARATVITRDASGDKLPGLG